MTHWFIKAGINRGKQVSAGTIGNMNGLSSRELEICPHFSSHGTPIDGGILFLQGVFPSSGHDLTRL